MNVASRSAVEECVGVIKTRLDNRRGDSGVPVAPKCDFDPPLLEPQSSQCREAAKYILIKSHCTSKMHIRSFIGGAGATGTLCFYSAAEPLDGLQGLEGRLVRLRRAAKFLRPAMDAPAFSL